METREKVAVLGAGNGGQTIAGVYASLLRYDTWICNRRSPAQRIEKIADTGIRISIEVLPHCNTHGRVRQGTFSLGGATYDFGEALEGARIIRVSAPDLGYPEIAEEISPHLEHYTDIFLHSCGLGAALEMKSNLMRNGCRAEGITISEIAALPYSTRVKRRSGAAEEGTVEVNLVKRDVAIASLPFHETPGAAAAVQGFFPFVPAKNPLGAAIENLGHVFHLPVMLYNANLWLGRKPWRFYSDGYANPRSREMVASLERERQEIARRLGFETQSASEFLFTSYGVIVENGALGEALQKFGYHGRKGPHSESPEQAVSISSGLRQITEEYYCKLFPLHQLARLIGGIKTPAMEEALEKGKELGLEPERFGRNLESAGNEKISSLRQLYAAYGYVSV